MKGAHFKLYTPKTVTPWRSLADRLPVDLIATGQHGGGVYMPSAYPLLWVVVDASGYGPTVAAFATAHEDPKELGLLHLRGVGVRPEYRGHGLQRRLLRARITYARRAGFERLSTYVAVTNRHSLANVIGAGFVPARVEDGYLILTRGVGR